MPSIACSGRIAARFKIVREFGKVCDSDAAVTNAVIYKKRRQIGGVAWRISFLFLFSKGFFLFIFGKAKGGCSSFGA